MNNFDTPLPCRERDVKSPHCNGNDHWDGIGNSNGNGDVTQHATLTLRHAYIISRQASVTSP